MKRRDFVRLGCATMIATRAGKPRSGLAESLGLRRVLGAPQHLMVPSEPKTTGRAADFTLQIAPMLVELAPQVVISTTGYNNKVPAPLLRMREGQLVTIDVENGTDVPEYVHWHGLLVPPEVDGAEEGGITNWAAISRTLWPCLRNARPKKCAPEQASKPISDVSMFAHLGVRRYRFPVTNPKRNEAFRPFVFRRAALHRPTLCH